MAEEMDNIKENNVEENVSKNVSNETAEVIKTTEESIVEAKTPTKKITLYEIEKMILSEQNNYNKFPDFRVGDTVKVYVRIVEGNKERLQPYEGVVIAMKHGNGLRKSFTVRRVSYGVAIERIFPYHSPYIEKVDVIRRGKVRRAKLYYMRNRYGKSARIKEDVNYNKK